ncbi:hypothetical protein [Paractinoplanes lichenicola]|uniref:Uncharacterized protein n=1 Tax=Paractinoplanes lichenicola TaxID=2802976 RepID=A0ABS1VDJ6_9ACTN|nr:hypothetical protein [Actinoplanes lichenicola]MBL7252760.1 hypothetical protein [Actinoplanes lichenicola]
MTRLVLTMVSRALRVEGRTREERLAELRAEMTADPGDIDTLVIRHLDWAILWGVILILVSAVTLPPLPVINLLADRSFTIAADVAFLLIFTALYLSCVQFAKALFAAYVIRDRWNPRNRLARAAMLAWPPDLIVAVGLAAVSVWH